MKGILAIIIVLCLLAGLGYYVSSRLFTGLSSLFTKLRFWPVMLTVAVITLILVLGFVRALTPFPTGIKHILGLVSAYCMGFYIYLLLYTVLADLVTAVPRIMKLSFTAQPIFKGAIAIAVLAMTLVTCIYGFINARQIDHISYKVQLNSKTDISDMRIVMISDLHLGAVGSESRLDNIVAEINSREPDIVCIAGDFFDTDYSAINDPDKALETIKGIKSTYGVYACLGNHDGGETLTQMTEFLKKADITLLNDAYTVIDDRLVLVGRLDAAAIGGYGDMQRKPLSSVLKRENTDMPVVVLDHNPANIDEYTTEADLILCGHTHKGQIFPGNIFTSLLYTVDYGYYRKDSQSPQVIVSSGVGAWGMPMRVGTDSEIVTVTFDCK